MLQQDVLKWLNFVVLVMMKLKMRKREMMDSGRGWMRVQEGKKNRKRGLKGIFRVSIFGIESGSCCCHWRGSL